MKGKYALAYGKAQEVRQAALTASLTSMTAAAAGGSADYAIQTLTQSTPFGFVNSDEAQTVMQVIINLQTRVNQLESRLQALGLIA